MPVSAGCQVAPPSSLLKIRVARPAADGAGGLGATPAPNSNPSEIKTHKNGVLKLIRSHGLIPCPPTSLSIPVFERKSRKSTEGNSDLPAIVAVQGFACNSELNSVNWFDGGLVPMTVRNSTWTLSETRRFTDLTDRVAHRVAL